ncbi:MAG: hypothetical protein ACLQVY_18495 [Limisphaerales bacterium]
MKDSLRIAALFGAVVLTAWPGKPLCAGLAYPGPPPGQAETTVANDSLTIANRALSAGCGVSGGRLNPLVVRSRDGQTLSFKGEPFQIFLADGARYPAGGLKMDGKPIASDLPIKGASARGADRIAGRELAVRLRSADGRLQVLWRAILHDGANYLRQEIEVTPLLGDVIIQKILWLDEPLPRATAAGSVDGSPVTAGNFFLGFEDPMSVNAIREPGGSVAERRVVSYLERNAVLKQGETLTVSCVIGVAPPGQMRRGFLCYVEEERAHPYRSFLHYNSWYDIAWDPFSLNETNCLDAIRVLGERFIKPHGMKMDSIRASACRIKAEARSSGGGLRGRRSCPSAGPAAARRLIC